jgi:predicted TIM-barrel fold metal-dependent hydrolase
MWGSDWPVTLLVASYEETLRGMRAALGALEPCQEASLFRTTAMEFYKLRTTTKFVDSNPCP